MIQINRFSIFFSSLFSILGSSTSSYYIDRSGSEISLSYHINKIELKVLNKYLSGFGSILKPEKSATNSIKNAIIISELRNNIIVIGYILNLQFYYLF